MSGMIIPSRENRVHVLRPQDWSRSAGTDFWAYFGPESITADSSTTLLSDFGWTTTSLVETAGSGADFLSSADSGVPPHLLTNASSDLLQSPSIFGGYIHGQQAADILGYAPSTLTMEFYGAMTVNSVSEVTVTGWGLVEAGGAAGTADDRMAWVSNDTSSFFLSNAADNVAGLVPEDTAWHRFTVVVSPGTTDAMEFFIDGTSYGTIDSQADLWPCSFGMFASTTNRPALSWVHIYYS